ncbi:MAG: flagellar M-ring protein FliF, partial [Lachnospiraceae bacterium]|nr:flagellar M-ring protein FliF [Lachnospiraceae bacterium]
MQEKLLARIKELWEKLKEWWNKFSAKQKTLIVMAGAAVIMAVVILVTILTRPKYEPLIVAEDTKEASQVRDLLDGEGYQYQISDDGLDFRVLASQAANARLLLGANEIQASG